MNLLRRIQVTHIGTIQCKKNKWWTRSERTFWSNVWILYETDAIYSRTSILFYLYCFSFRPNHTPAANQQDYLQDCDSVLQILHLSQVPRCSCLPDSLFTQGLEIRGGLCLTCCLWPHSRLATQKESSSLQNPEIFLSISDFQVSQIELYLI